MKNIILAHKDFEWNEYLFDKPIVYTQNDIKTNLDVVKYDGLDNRIYGEFSLWKCIAETEKDDSEWYTLHHYRRLFEPYYNHISLPLPLINDSLYNNLAFLHSIELADLMKNDMNLPIDKIYQFFPYNIFSAPLFVIKEWVSFVDNYLQIAQNKLNIKTFEESLEFVKNNENFTKSQEGKNTDIVYQSRIYATLTERLNTIFWLNFREACYFCPVKLLEANMVM